jgi:hypothetical protein
MHPTLMHEIARYRQADMLREAQRARLAHEASLASDEPRRRFRLRRKTQAPVLGRPALSR